MTRLLTAILLALTCATTVQAAPLPSIRVSPDQKGFVTEDGQPFVPWGVNYDRDHDGRLLEDYWEAEWERVAGDFREMRELGFNVVRVHLQFGRFMEAADEPNADALARLKKLLELAESERLYLDLTGLGCYHKRDVPAWYDALDEAGRWRAQGRFWEAVARTAADSPAVFCYDLMNEPVVPGGKREPGDWLGPDFAGKHFVQFITLDPQGRTRPEIAKAWIHELVAAVRRADRKHLVTVGLVDWSLDRPGLSSGFVPKDVTADLDFVAVHLYPKNDHLREDLETLKGFQVGKPVLIEETFPLAGSIDTLRTFLKEARPHAAGVISFYWGKTPEELDGSDTLRDVLTREWLRVFPSLKW